MTQWDTGLVSGRQSQQPFVGFDLLRSYTHKESDIYKDVDPLISNTSDWTKLD